MDAMIPLAELQPIYSVAEVDRAAERAVGGVVTRARKREAAGAEVAL